MNWALMLTHNALPYTKQTIPDLLAQDIPTSVYVVDNASSDGTVEWLKENYLDWHGRVMVFTSATNMGVAKAWNLGLHQIMHFGGQDEVLVVNNDIRLRPDTYRTLKSVRGDGLLVSAVNVGAEAWASAEHQEINLLGTPKGGPDFSCYLISKECHVRYPFDEGFWPAYGEDLDLHRRIMLGGEGPRVFSVSFPYLHFASKTLEASPELHAVVGQSREYYAKKWGPLNKETKLLPFGEDVTEGCVMTPILQSHGCKGGVHPIA